MRSQVIYCGDRRISGEELRLNAKRAASGFASLGLKRGDTVAVMLRNELAYLETMLALGQLGVYLVAVNWHFRSEEAMFIVRDSGAKLLLMHADLIGSLEGALPADLPVIAVATPPEVCAMYGIAPERGTVPAGRIDYDAWRNSFPPRTAPPAPSPGSIIYTSGTTGRPKGVRRFAGTPEQQQAAVRTRILVSQIRDGMRTAVVGPLYHAGPNSSARAALDMADVVVVMPRFDAELLLRMIEQHRLTHLMLVPIMMVRLLKLDPAIRAKYDVSSLENVTHGGSPCPPDVKRQIIDWLGPIVFETYGSTEAGLISLASSEEWLRYPGTIGKPFPGTRVRILNEAGEDVKPGEVGEIFANPGENALPFTYHNHDDLRRQIDRDGYITNGDMGYLNEDGYLFITDRRRDMVISGGVNIYPAEIEGVLATCPGVFDCAVFGIPDSEFGEVLAAAVQLQPGASLTAEEARAFLRERLAGYKVPRVVDFHAALPRESMGKVFKNQLREPYWRNEGRKI